MILLSLLVITYKKSYKLCLLLHIIGKCQKMQKKATKINLKANNPSQQQLNSLLEYYQNGQFNDAENLAVSITNEFPKHQFGWKVLGAVLKQTGRVIDSLTTMQKSVQLAPQDAESHNNLGVTLQELGRLDEALTSYNQAIALKSDYVEAHSNFGNTLKELGRLDEALASYTQAIALNPDYAEAHYNLGNTLKELGRLDEAEVSYKQAIALKPDDFAKAYDDLGVILQSNGKYKDAEICYKKYQSLEPNSGSKTKSRGEILFYQGDFKQALRVFDSYDNISSKGRALECLYRLGQIDSIYERIAVQPNLNYENIRVAAIAAFLTDRTKKDTAHDFCNNPLDFIHVSNIASHIEDSNLFITEIIDELHNVKTDWELNTTRNGFQASINVFKNPLEKMKFLKSIIIDELNFYYTKFKNEPCSYITKWPSEKIVSGWHVILKQQGYQSAHIHPTGWLSGVIYLKNVPTMGKHEGAIKFSLDSPSYPDNCSSRKIHEPEVGDIVFFPSSLHHRTIPFTTDADRIIVSFDLKPEAAKS